VIVDGEIVGALVVEQTTHGLLALRNSLARDTVRNVIIVFAIGLFLLIIFASLVSTRINRLTRQLSQLAGTSNAAGALSATGAFTVTDGKRDGRLSARLADEITDLAQQFTGVTLRLKQNNQHLENLSKRLAHELRTPIAVVRSSLDNLEMAGNTERDIYVARAREGIERLSTILNNMTEATRLEESLDPAETEYFDLVEVVRGCVDGYRAAYPEQVFDLSIEGEFEKLSGLPDLVAQMLDKLVSNAVSFATRATPIKIRLTRERDAVIRVINTGPQLPDIVADSLFGSMTSVRSMGQDAAGQASSSHLGLGLYIAKLIAEFHGGRISAHNREDTTGVVVTVYLPFMRITGRA
jgi:signal transduction histidine kinase